MDLVECEAPLDNSFQKDRLELVNKGSLGRRRKPSRSNLRLILSPSDDRQIIDVFHNHHPFASDGSFIQEKPSPTKVLKESPLDNHQKSVIREKIFTSNNQRTVSDNYREVVGSIKQIYSNNCFDLNGNNQRTVSSLKSKQNCSSLNQEEKNRNNLEKYKSESKNSVNSKYHSEISVTKNRHNGITCDHKEVPQLSNGHLPNKFRYYEEEDESKIKKTSEYNNHYVKISNGYLPDKCNHYKNGDSKILKEPEDKICSAILSNGHLPNKSNYYKDDDVSKNQKISQVQNHRQMVNGSKQLQTPKIHQNVITFSNHRQIITSAPPFEVKKSVLTNGNSHISPSQDYSTESYIEPSLPRTSKEPSLVEEARQFSIEAKLKRKYSDVQGRSAVLIQTWERRTQFDSHLKSKKDSKTTSKNRFSDKEICDTHTSATPDSYICTKYKGSLQNGDNLEKGELVSCVRDVRLDETMLYRVSEDKHSRMHLSGHTNGVVTVNGNSCTQEPEWISLSRKLCAKFVEGHIDSNSPDSYPYEEPEGVGEDLISSPPSKNNHSGSISTTTKTETQKKKVTPTITFTEETAASDEPPWIHLSRKLCNKFIEEHIEYPPITNGHFVEVPELVEPNGDVRIIEKIGKPKGHKSKQKKECEPEWVSLSKKLRAKFIESHIDDPDTIALDNQLNASDPEETGSETLSDISQDTQIPKEISRRSTPVECKNYVIKDRLVQDSFGFEETESHLKEVDNEENKVPSIYPEKECCWEYQEMEFDQESSSGNFQDPEYDDQPAEEIRIQRTPLPHENSDQYEERVTFSNSFFSRNSECFNNDVKFIPYSDDNEVVSTSPEQNKLITVQFIAHTKKEQQDGFEDEARVSPNDQSIKKEPFFNFSSWEVAHYEHQEADDLKNSEEIPLYKDCRSKSLDNLCDSLEEGNLVHKKKRTSICSADNFDVARNVLFVSEKLVNEERKINKGKADFGTSCDITFTIENDNCNCTCERRISRPEDDMACSRDVYMKEERKNFCDKKERDSSSEDDVFEYVPRKRDQSSRSSESNSSRKIHSPENLKQEIQYSKSRKLSSSENLNKEILYNMSRKLPSPEILKKEVQTNQSKNISSPETLKKELQYNKSRNMSSPERLKKEMKSDRVQNNKENTKNGYSFENGKSVKCNGMIPNSVYDPFHDNKTSTSKHNENKKSKLKEPAKMGMSKWITMSKSEQNISKPEYSNVQSFFQKEQHSPAKSPESDAESKDKRRHNKISNEKETTSNSRVRTSSRSDQSKIESHNFNNMYRISENADDLNISPKYSDLKTKCKSLCDVSRINNSVYCEETKFRQHESVDDLCSSTQTLNHHPEIEFQHFASVSEIPLCAKLVSSQDKRISKSIPSITPTTNRTESPCPSDTSHVYEDMFKETPSGPSNTEPSSWTVLKHNTYYVNGRSSSMNDLDFSDSGSMSVKCDYASSSESGTWQSRHSSYASSSFYVNLRDYDSHMLEPNLNKIKKSNGMAPSNGNPSNASKSSPPTPESLRQLFASPLTSIHASSNSNTRILNRMPSDPQSHYYSTAAVASSAFKHGFAPTTSKPKKTERSSSIKIKDIAQGIILTFKKLQNHSKNSSLPSDQHVDVSHLAELKGNSEMGKTKKGRKDSKSKKNDKIFWTERARSEFDSGFLSDAQRVKARRSSSDLTDWKSNSELFHSDKKKSKKKSGSKEKGKKSKSKAFESRTVPTVSRKVQQMADGTLHLVTTVSGDSTMPGVYSDSPDTSSELSSHRSVKNSGESNC